MTSLFPVIAIDSAVRLDLLLTTFNSSQLIGYAMIVSSVADPFDWSPIIVIKHRW